MCCLDGMTARANTRRMARAGGPVVGPTIPHSHATSGSTSSSKTPPTCTTLSYARCAGEQGVFPFYSCLGLVVQSGCRNSYQTKPYVRPRMLPDSSHRHLTVASPGNSERVRQLLPRQIARAQPPMVQIPRVSGAYGPGAARSAARIRHRYP